MFIIWKPSGKWKSPCLASAKWQCAASGRVSRRWISSFHASLSRPVQGLSGALFLWLFLRTVSHFLVDLWTQLDICQDIRRPTWELPIEDINRSRRPGWAIICCSAFLSASVLISASWIYALRKLRLKCSVAISWRVRLQLGATLINLRCCECVNESEAPVGSRTWWECLH